MLTGIPDVTAERTEKGLGWRLVPVVVVRQAGFAFGSLVNDVAADVETTLDSIDSYEAAALDAADQMKRLLRARPVPRPKTQSLLGQLRPLSRSVMESLRDELSDQEYALAVNYQESLEALNRSWRAFEDQHRRWLDEARVQLAGHFRCDPLLREALMLSNDARFADHADWLDSFTGHIRTERDRKTADLLAMYAQRVTARNETHSHFGPFTVARIGSRDGIHWERTGPLHRTAFFTHWAAERLATVFACRPALFPHTTPRRYPAAFVEDGHAIRYGLTIDVGAKAWTLRPDQNIRLSPRQAGILAAATGDVTELRIRQWHEKQGGAGDADRTDEFRDLYDNLSRNGLLCGGFEIPVGDPYPLAALRSQIPVDGSEDSIWAHRILHELESLVDAFSRAEPTDRPAILNQLKSLFEEVTGSSANRGSGAHHADRSIMYEECHGPLHDLTIGPNIAATIADELAVVYDLALVGPRLRLHRETELITDWFAHSFDSNQDVPLGDFYREYFQSRPQLLLGCDAIDREVDAVGHRLADAILGSADLTVQELTVDASHIQAIIGDYPFVPAVCNPDVMLAAADASALENGDYDVLVGECHAVREVLTHTSFTPLVQQRAPELTPAVLEGHQSLLAADELLCDVIRTHADKTGNQIVYPGFDIEVAGRSMKPRSQVLQLADLSIRRVNGRLELRAHGIDRRIRLLAPPTGGSSVRTDPLTIFGFPRHFGRVAITPAQWTHLPRLRAGRVVISRERWRLPARFFSTNTVGPRISGPTNKATLTYASNRRLARKRRMPRWVFANVPGQPKPILVDFAQPLSVRPLMRLCGSTSGDVELTEMFPAPERLWLKYGARSYTSEIRCCLFSATHPTHQPADAPTALNNRPEG